MTQIIFLIIITILCLGFITDKILDYLNVKSWAPQLPEGAEGIYDEEKYRKAGEYQKTKYRFSLLTSTFSFLLILSMLFFHGFGWLDEQLREITQHPILLALLFFGMIGIASDIIGMPFDLYNTFVIEEKFGFNKTTLKTYFFDKLKGYLLGIIVGGGILSAIVWIYESTGSYFWLLAWVTIGTFTILASMFYASWILPLFNKLTPLPEGELRTAIEEYSKKVGFKLDNIFVMDGSRRSTKSNAFFSGLGAKKKIVLYDTLIEKHSTDELVGVLAHEVGHYKKKHTLWGIVFGIIQTGFMLFLMSLLLGKSYLSSALGAAHSSFHLDILVIGMLYGPLSELLGILTNMISRKNEYEADQYAAETYKAKPLMEALKKLTSDNLGNLTPHPVYVFVHYSHPPVLKRLDALGKKVIGDR